MMTVLAITGSNTKVSFGFIPIQAPSVTLRFSCVVQYSVNLTVPLVAYESIVKIIVDNEQFSNQLFLTQTGDQLHYSILHALTY